MSSTFQTQTLVYNVPFNLVYGTRYLVKSVQPLQITLGIKMYYSGAQYQFVVLSGGSVILDGSIVRQVQLLTNIMGVNIVEGAVALPARDDVFNRNPARILFSSGVITSAMGSSGPLFANYSVPNLRKFEGHIYAFIGPTTTTALTGTAYLQASTTGSVGNPDYYMEANTGSVLPIAKSFPIKMLSGETLNTYYGNTSGQTLTLFMSLRGLESDV